MCVDLIKLNKIKVGKLSFILEYSPAYCQSKPPRGARQLCARPVRYLERGHKREMSGPDLHYAAHQRVCGIEVVA